MTLLRGTNVLLYAAFGETYMSYQRDTPSAYDNLPYPEATFSVLNADGSLGLVSDLGGRLENWRVGLSATLPWGDGGAYKRSYGGRPSSQRYHVIDGLIGQLFIGLVTAYRINRYLSIGAGVDVIGFLIQQRYQVDLGARINQVLCESVGATTCPINAPIAREDPLYAGEVSIDALAFSAGGIFGLLVTPWPWLRLGLSLHTNAGRMSLPAELSVRVPEAVSAFVGRSLPGVLPSALRAEADIHYGTPMILIAGVGALPSERLEVGVDLHWMNLSFTETISAVVRRSDTSLIDDVRSVRGRNDQWRFAFRGSYLLLDDLKIGTRVEYVRNARPEHFVTP